MQISIIVFFVTYAFLGLEYVSIELDDPFGNDPNGKYFSFLIEVTSKIIIMISYNQCEIFLIRFQYPGNGASSL